MSASETARSFSSSFFLETVQTPTQTGVWEGKHTPTPKATSQDSAQSREQASPASTLPLGPPLLAGTPAPALLGGGGGGAFSANRLPAKLSPGSPGTAQWPLSPSPHQAFHSHELDLPWSTCGPQQGLPVLSLLSFLTLHFLSN